MLNSLRKSAGSWVVKILLGLLVVSFAIWGVGDIFRGGASNTLATVGDREISPQEFERNFQNQVTMVSNQLGRRLTTQEARAFGIGQRVLENLIGTTAIGIHAEDLGLGISQDAVTAAIRQERTFEGADGKFDPGRFQEILRSVGMNEGGFIALQREEMVREQLLGALSRGAYAPKTLLDAANNYRNDERVVKYFVIPPSAIGEVASPDETALKAYYEDNKGRYMAPEYRKIELLILTPEAIKETISLTDEDIKKSYEDTKQAYATPERRTVSQLVFKDMAAAREAADKLGKGADFEALGKELGMTESDMSLGTVAKTGLADKKIAEAAFALAKDKTSEPIDGFAPVIVKVTDIQAGTQKSFEEVKDQVRDALARTRAGEEISKLFDAIEDERGGGAKLAEAARKLNLNYREYTIDRSGIGLDGKPVEAVVANRAVAQLAFDSDVGVENNPVTLGEGYAFLDVTEVIPERQKSLDEVREQAKAAWIDDQKRKLVRAKADGLMEKAKAGAPLDQLAAEVKGKVETTPALKRDAAPSGLPRTAVSLAFTLPKDGVGSVQMPDQLSQAVIQVTEIKPAAALDAKAEETLREELRRSVAVDIVTQYVGGLQKTYGVSVNSSAISAVIGQ
jgi:peptidyl-prolyl cis-trans isomerase D